MTIDTSLGVKGKGFEVLNDNVRAFLGEERFAVLATIKRDGAPQQTVMWYELQGDQIMMNTAEGRVKAHNFRRDPRVSICIEDGYRFVSISGHVELNEDRELALNDIHQLAVRYHGQEKADAMMDGFRKDVRVTILMSIDHVITNGF
jgi:PPOX class probable F420-dependent enzyme